MITGVRIHLKPGITGTAWLGSRGILTPVYQYKSDNSSGTPVVFESDQDNVLLDGANQADNNVSDPGTPSAPTAGDVKWAAQFNAYCEASQGIARHNLTLTYLTSPNDFDSVGSLLPAKWYYDWLLRQLSNMESPEQESKWDAGTALVEGHNLIVAPLLAQPLYMVTSLVVGTTFQQKPWYGEADLGNFGNFMESYAGGSGGVGGGTVPAAFGETRYLNCLTQRFKLVHA